MAGLTAVQGEEQPNVSPEEQAEYDAIVNNAYNLLYENIPTTLESIAGGGDPVTGLAQTVANTMSRLVNSATKAGKKFSGAVILHAGVEILEDLASLAQDSGIHDFTPDELESATYLAAETFRDLQQKAGNLDPNVAAGDLEALQQAEADGTLDQIIPGVSEKFTDFQQVPSQNQPDLRRPSRSQSTQGLPRRGLAV
ncbi:MAG: hypothetical protein IH908_08390 [Proteobacteria bacterium]|nr:hypothetical protein [Pseudomonadota bacterium]